MNANLTTKWIYYWLSIMQVAVNVNGFCKRNYYQLRGLVYYIPMQVNLNCLIEFSDTFVWQHQAYLLVYNLLELHVFHWFKSWIQVCKLSILFISSRLLILMPQVVVSIVAFSLNLNIISYLLLLLSYFIYSITFKKQQQLKLCRRANLHDLFSIIAYLSANLNESH